MNLKAIEEMYHWKPQDGDYTADVTAEQEERGLNWIINRIKIFSIYKKLIFIILKYF